MRCGWFVGKRRPVQSSEARLCYECDLFLRQSARRYIWTVDAPGTVLVRRSCEHDTIDNCHHAWTGSIEVKQPWPAIHSKELCARKCNPW